MNEKHDSQNKASLNFSSLRFETVSISSKFSSISKFFFLQLVHKWQSEQYHFPSGISVRLGIRQPKWKARSQQSQIISSSSAVVLCQIVQSLHSLQNQENLSTLFINNKRNYNKIEEKKLIVKILKKKIDCKKYWRKNCL